MTIWDPIINDRQRKVTKGRNSKRFHSEAGPKKLDRLEQSYQRATGIKFSGKKGN